MRRRNKPGSGTFHELKPLPADVAITPERVRQVVDTCERATTSARSLLAGLASPDKAVREAVQASVLVELAVMTSAIHLLVHGRQTDAARAFWSRAGAGTRAGKGN